MAVNKSPLESDVQIAVVQYLDILERQGKVLWYSGSGNGQFQKSIGVRMKMKREGIRAGMPDIMVVFLQQIVFIELKREKGSYPSEEQKKAIEAINKAGDQGNVSAFVAYGFEEAKNIINNYI